jgi:hypothetical protein
LVEHPHGKGEVAGSIPAIGSAIARPKPQCYTLYMFESISQLGKKTFSLYRSKFFIFFILGLITYGVTLIQLVSVGVHSMILFILSVVATIIVSYIIYLALIRVATDPGRMTVGEVLTRIEHFIIPAAKVSILILLIVLGGTLILIIPGIIALVYVMFSVFAVVIDHHQGLDAIGFSWNLVKGRWWYVFGRLVIANLVIGIMSLIIISIFWSLGIGETPVQTIARVHLGYHDVSISQSIVSEAIFDFFTLPFTICFLGVLYDNLKNTAQSDTVSEKAIEDSKKYIKILAILGIVFVIVIAIFISNARMIQIISQYIRITHAPASVFSAF